MKRLSVNMNSTYSEENVPTMQREARSMLSFADSAAILALVKSTANAMLC